MENYPSPSPMRQWFATIPHPRQKGSPKFCNGATTREGGGGKGRQMATANHPGMYGYKGGNLRALKRAGVGSRNAEAARITEASNPFPKKSQLSPKFYLQRPIFRLFCAERIGGRAKAMGCGA